ncbi:virulence factor [Aquincola sp. S2]|uniref:Virulence factor n=1 Tax=Pseudaquabacterium terrae TaxID=2732868 RepID=A0ABX2EER8_9BURK|nr:virulence factor SrfC family protein [Aquabacterium terrae]NRF67104.1 virulence factor [Aquabacterium terrae]
MSIDPIQQTLADGARALASASSQARGWVARVSQSATRVANEGHSLIEATRRAENLSRKLAASSGRRNSAGVFGPSQAGKSYLVSVLGRSKDAPLLADFAGDTKNFITEINPEGGKEATGLVTRFTIVRGSRDKSHPVELRLLSETDLVKILGNGFLSDFDEHNRKLGLPGEEEVRAVIARLEPLAKSSAQHLDEIVMFDVGEYFKGTFSSSIGPLTRGGFWDALTRFGHKLPTAQRIELYSLLWGQNADFTAIYTLLHKTLEALGHAATARAALNCLLPRTTSIIDVDILKHRLGTLDDQKDLVSVVPELSEGGGDGPPVPVARATLTGLVAEIKVVMADKPWQFFEHTDLLDFPGARSREKNIDLPADPQERAFSVRNILLRGKIAYLFQRYTEERELTCMLLCMPPSNQDVKDLTALVGKWVAQTHGDNAQSRAQLPNALFFVLTKFDGELVDKPGDTPESWASRIDTRLEASMYQLYKQEDWLQNWNGQAFNNTYFLRNPGFRPAGVFQYEGDGDARQELGIATEAAPRINASRQGLLDSERCRKHFVNPALAWDSAMAFNDGGVRYLVENLERVLSPKLKTRQLAGRLVDQAQALDARLRVFYAAGDDASRKEKEAALMDLRRRLYRACNEREFRNFALLLARLQLAEPDVRAAFLNVASLRLDTAPAAAPVAASPAAEDDPWADDPWAVDAEATINKKAPAKTQPIRRQRDRADHFAGQVINLWADRVRGLAADAKALTALGLDSAIVGALTDELVIGAHRQQLADRIAERIRRQLAAANVRWDEVADRAAAIAATMVNDHVTYLGYGDLPEADRPGTPEAPKTRARGVFALPLPPARGSLPALPEQRGHPEREFFVDWGVALLQLGRDNLNFAGGREIDEEDNRALGQILETMGVALRVGT